MLEQHHQEAAEHGEQIEYQQRDKSPSERHEQKAGRSQNERHRQVGRLPELGNRQKAIPAALRDGPGPDERVHHRLVMLEDELEKKVGDNEAQADSRNQHRRKIGNPFFPQHEKQQQLQEPEIDDDNNLPHHLSLVLLAEELVEAKTRQDTNRVYSHSFRKMESQTLKDPLRTPLFR